MKYLALFWLFVPSLLFAQEENNGNQEDSIESQHQIPINPNVLDEQGRKIGKWTILFDEDGNETDSVENAHHYRLITYDEGNPVGKTKEYYRSGQIQWEGDLISENPDKIDGEVISYSENGNAISLFVFRNGRFDRNETIVGLNKVKEKWNQDETQADYVTLLQNLARMYQGQDSFWDAEILLKKALSILKLLGEKDSKYRETLRQLIVLYYDSGRYLDALTYKLKEIELFNDIDEPLYFGNLIYIADLYSKTGQYEIADSIIHEVLVAEKEALGENHGRFLTYQRRAASIYLDQGQYEKAESLLLSTLEAKEKLYGKNEDYGITLLELARLDKIQHQFEKSESNYIECENIFFEKKSFMLKYSLRELAWLYQEYGNYEKAESYYLKSLPVLKEEVGENHPEYVAILKQMAQLYYLMENRKADSLFLWTKEYYIKYLNNMFDDLGEREREQFYATILEYFEIFQNFAIEESKNSPEILSELYDLQLATKSILLNTSSQVKKRILESNDRVLIALYDEVQSLKQINGRYQNLPLEQIDINIDSLNELLSEKDKQLSEYASYYTEEKKQRTWQDIKSTLGKSESAIEIIRIKKWDFQKRKSTDTVLYAALIVTTKTKKFPELVLFENGNELEEKYIHYYRNMIRISRGKKYDTLSYDQYWSPLKKHLKGIKTIYFSPDGIYNSINIETLYNSKSKKYLMEEVDIRLVTSTKDLLATKSPFMPYNYAVLMGNPDFGQETQMLATRDVSSAFTLDSLIRNGISSLPGTKVEIETLQGLFNEKGWDVEVWTEQEATEEHLKNMLKPKVLHIATHGFFEPDDDEHTYQNNPLYRSGLLLSGAEQVFQKEESVRRNTILGKEDGILTAFEAMNLNIENTELVVLSACETGLGEIRNGEGVYGLQRAFQVAGARSLLISLWKVSDQVTQELMVEFYTNWLGGMSKREALKKTQIALKEKYESPFYWGAFVLVGE